MVVLGIGARLGHIAPYGSQSRISVTTCRFVGIEIEHCSVPILGYIAGKPIDRLLADPKHQAPELGAHALWL